MSEKKVSSICTSSTVRVRGVDSEFVLFEQVAEPVPVDEDD